jgi:hypothetical protein
MNEEELFGTDPCPSGCDINLTSGLLPASRVSFLSVYVTALSSLVAQNLFNDLDGGTP